MLCLLINLGGFFCCNAIVGGGGGVVMVWMCMFTYTVWEVGHTSE